MRVTRYVQSTIQIQTPDGRSVLIDPGTWNFEPGKFTHDRFPKVSLLVVTHKHADHCDLDAVAAFEKRDRPLVVTNAELAPQMAARNIHARVVNPGESVMHAGITLTALPADHVVRGEVIVIFSALVTIDGWRAYHPSDTRYMDPARLPGVPGCDLLLVPIGNRGLVMGMDDAAYFARQVKPRHLIPIHYEAPADRDRIRPETFAALFTAADGFGVTILGQGQSIDLTP